MILGKTDKGPMLVFDEKYEYDLKCLKRFLTEIRDETEDEELKKTIDDQIILYFGDPAHLN